MNRRRVWAAILGALLLAGLAGVLAWNAGVHYGAEQSGKELPQHWGRHHGHGPWGIIFIPLFFIAFWLVLGRIFWRGGCGPYHRFDEWHRQAHERMWNEPRGGTQA